MEEKLCDTKTINVYPVPPLFIESEEFNVYCCNKKIPVIEFKNAGKTEYSYVCFSIEPSAYVELLIKVNEPIVGFRIRPDNYYINGNIEGNTLKIQLDQPRHIIVEINDMKRLIILADAHQVLPVLFESIKEYNICEAPYFADNKGLIDMTTIIQMGIDEIAAKGGGVLRFQAGTYLTGGFTIKNGVYLHLEGGSALKAIPRPECYEFLGPKYENWKIGQFIGFQSGASHCGIIGRGIIDLDGGWLHEKDNWHIFGMIPLRGKEILLDGFILTGSTFWSIVPVFCENVTIENVKVLNSLNIYENDGIDPIGCQHVRISNCLTYTNDDGLCPKASNDKIFKGRWGKGALDIYDVVFEDCVVVSRCAACKCGMQGSTHMYDIWFKNIQVISASRGIAIMHSIGDNVMEDIHFVDIHVEDLVKKTYEPFPFEIIIQDREGIGQVRNVEFTRISFKSRGKVNARLQGFDENHCIENVVFTNLVIEDNLVENPEMYGIEVNAYVKGLQFIVD